MSLELNKDSNEYRLAERIVFLQEALDTANERFAEKGELGILPQTGNVSFRKAKKHHAKIRAIIKTLE